MIVERKSGSWSESAVRVLKERYLWRKDGKLLEDPDGMCRRVAGAVAAAERAWGAGEATVERVAEDFYQVMVDRQFMPNSPTLMNAGKNNGQQLSACFVLPVGDSLPEIFDAIKHAAIIHQSGGGCIAGDAHVFTTFCGVESIATLYDRVHATGKVEQDHGDHAVIDVTDLGIRTMALDPEHGSYVPASLTHLWRYTVPRADQLRVRCADGLEVTTSRWHPFMIFTATGFVERRADQLQPGDLLSTPNRSVRDHWPHQTYRVVHGIRLDEEIAWFLGYLVGSGTAPDSVARDAGMRIVERRTTVLEQARTILAQRFAVPLAADEAAGTAIAAAGSLRRIRALLGADAAPAGEVFFPEMVAKSPLRVVGAFLAGLVDSAGGAVDAGQRRVSVHIAQETVARKVHTLCSLLGLAPGLHLPDAAGASAPCAVSLAAGSRLADLQELIGAHVHDTVRRTTLAGLAGGPDTATAPALPIPFAALEDVLRSLGIDTGPAALRQGPVRIGTEVVSLQHWQEQQAAGADLLVPLIAALRPLVDRRYQARLDVLARLLEGAAVVSTITQPEHAVPFYDFTVAGYSTYLAGTGGLTAIHNTGFGLSRLRPEGSAVRSTQGVASGPISFLRVFNAATEAVKQGGTRRGANMGVLRVDHPDILKFIDCKRPDPVTGVRDITNFNISVAATNAFMAALERGEEYDLVDPHTKQVTGRLNARQVFDAICAAAWSTGDPGLLFIDRANESPSNPIPELEQLEATNPCVVGETWLATGSGPARARDLHASGEALSVVTDVRAARQAALQVINGPAATEATGVEQHRAAPVFQTGTQVPVWTLTTSHGIRITATPNHRFLTTEGYRRLDQLQYGDTLLLQSAEGAWSTDATLPAGTRGPRSEPCLQTRDEAHPPAAWSAELGETLGYLLGNGHVHRSTAGEVISIVVTIADRAIADTLQARTDAWFGVAGNRSARQEQLQITYEGTVASFMAGLGLMHTHAHEKRVPEPLFRAPRAAVVGFLRGLFSADGSVHIDREQGTCSVRLATPSRDLAQDVQHLLLNFGIVSAIRLRRQVGITLVVDAAPEPAEDAARMQYELIVDKDNRDRFASLIGFMQERTHTTLRQWIGEKYRVSERERFTTQVALIEDAGRADVYDTTEPVTHSLILNGFVCHNCGEQWLGGYDACNLGSINLANCTQRQEDGTYSLDWTELERVTRITTRFLDNVIEINPLPLPQIIETVRANRRVGLGVMGWADLLFLLGISYDTDEALALGEEVMGFINRMAHDESQRLAETRGAFPNFSRSIYRDGPPLRNATLTTVAPTGSISIFADCSSGIEPVFALAFMHVVDRGKPTERKLVMTNPYFERIAHEQGFYSEELMHKIGETGTVHDLPEVPERWRRVFVTAHEVHPAWHIKMQAAFQHTVDNSISKTVNLPNSAVVEDVAEAYLLAWSTGCKGITVFRDGCLATGQVLNGGTTEAKPAGIPTAPAVPAPPAPALPATVKPRPQTVFGYTRRVKAPEGTANITINSDEEGPLEVFVNVGRAGSDIAALAEALGRLISLNLRLPSPIPGDDRLQLMATQLHGIGGSRSIGFGAERVLSLPDAVAQALTWHLEQGLSQVPPPISGTPHRNGAPAPLQLTLPALKMTGNICPQCGSTAAFVLEEGCKKCHSCGYSEC